MKKLLFILLASVFSMRASAQHTVPRYSTSSLGNKTFANQKIGHLAITDAALQDTITIVPSSYQTNVFVNLTDTLCVFVNYGSSYVGDKMTFVVTNSSGANHFLKFTSRAGVASPIQAGSGTATLALTSAKLATISFIFNGSSWLEESRLVQ